MHHGVLGRGLGLTSHFFPKNGFVGIWWHLIARLLPLPRFLHDPSTEKVPFQVAAGWLSPVEDPSLYCGSTHSSYTPLLLEELSFRYSASSSLCLATDLLCQTKSYPSVRPAPTAGLTPTPTPGPSGSQSNILHYGWTMMEMSETLPHPTPSIQQKQRFSKRFPR